MQLQATKTDTDKARRNLSLLQSPNSGRKNVLDLVGSGGTPWLPSTFDMHCQLFPSLLLILKHKKTSCRAIILPQYLPCSSLTLPACGQPGMLSTPAPPLRRGLRGHCDKGHTGTHRDTQGHTGLTGPGPSDRLLGAPQAFYSRTSQQAVCGLGKATLDAHTNTLSKSTPKKLFNLN